MHERPRTLAFALALVAMAAVTALFRFLSLASGFTNDQFLHLANAQQMLYGEWPTRDFFDAGMPLMYVVSALAQALFGRTLFAEALLVSAAFAAAAVLTALAVRELTGSRLIALAAALLEVAIVPRAYGYPKILVYAAGFLLLQRYAARPTTARMAALAAGVVIAFLWRHDHGVFLGVAGGLAAWLAGGRDGHARGARAAVQFAVVTAALALPYLVYVQIHGGLRAYVQKGLEFRDREFARAEYVWPTPVGDEPWQALLLYVYWALPALAAAVVFAGRRRDGGWTAARVVPVIAVALLLNVTYARPPLNARLPDAIVPVVVLGAWLTVRGWHASSRWAPRAATAAGGLVFAAAVMALGDSVAQLERAGMLDHWSRWPRTVHRTRALLEAPHADVMLPSGAAEALVPFYDYVRRCTPDDHRLLIVGVIPEVAFFSQRPFAGGQAILAAGYYESEPYQRAVLAHLTGQTVPFVVIPGASYIGDFDASFPIVAAHVRGRYRPLSTFGEGEDTAVDVLVNSALHSKRHDAQTGWPCWR